MDSSPRPPAQRLSSTLHRSSSARKRFETEDLQVWTAARCQRLLRQLQARLAALRKLKYQQLSKLAVASKRGPSQENGATSKRIRHTYGQKDKPSTSPAEWTTTTTPLRPRRALGTMRPDHSSPVSGPTDFRTPVWNKIRMRKDTPIRASSQNSFSLEDEPIPAIPIHILEGMQSLQQVIADAQYRLCQAILEWLNGLLRSTAAQSHHTRANRSLLAMCLRRVPACIVSIEAWDQEHLGQKRSSWNSSLIAFDIYNQLEEFGPGGVGWRPLRLVVRSQAILMLSNAISEGLFHPSFTSLLVRLCAHLDCIDEAAKLACSMDGELPEPRTMRSNFGEKEQLQPLHSLLLSHAEGRASGPVFECMATLIEGRRLPNPWLCTRGLSRLWASSLENMASNNAKPSALKFMRAAIISLIQCSQTLRKPGKCSIEQTLISIAGGVTAAALTLEAEIRNRSNDQGERAWRRLIHLLDSSIASIRILVGQKGGHGNGPFILVFARGLAVMESCLLDSSCRQQAAMELETMTRTVVASARKDALYRQMILLICTIVQCRRRAYAIPSHDDLGDICSKLDKLRLPDWYVKAVRKDTAFMLAQRTKDLRDLVFAENLPSMSDNLSISTIFSGWRWEEGISEWVLPGTEIGPTLTNKSRITKRQGLRSQSTGRKQVSSFSPPRETSGMTLRGQHEFVVRTKVRTALATLSQSRAMEDDKDELL